MLGKLIKPAKTIFEGTKRHKFGKFITKQDTMWSLGSTSIINNTKKTNMLDMMKGRGKFRK